MNQSMQERLAQRHQRREERRKREEEEQLNFGARFEEPTASASMDNSTLSLSSSHSTGDFMGKSAPEQLQQMDASSSRRGRAREGGIDTSIRGSQHQQQFPVMSKQTSLLSLRPPARDTRTYNNMGRLSLAPPNKDTRRYNNSNDNSEGDLSLPSGSLRPERGREPKRGNLQRTRSRSLTDLRQGAAPSWDPLAAPKTPKTPGRHRLGVKRASVRSMAVPNTNELSPKAETKTRRGGRRPSEFRSSDPCPQSARPSGGKKSLQRFSGAELPFDPLAAPQSARPAGGKKSLELNAAAEIPFDPFMAPQSARSAGGKKRISTSSKRSLQSIKSLEETATIPIIPKPARSRRASSAVASSAMADGSERRSTNTRRVSIRDDSLLTTPRQQRKRPPNKKMSPVENMKTPRGTRMKVPVISLAGDNDSNASDPNDIRVLPPSSHKTPKASKMKIPVLNARQSSTASSNSSSNPMSASTLMLLEKDDDPEEEQEVLFTPYRTPGPKSKQSVGLAKFASPPLSQSIHSTASNKEGDGVAGWSMANPDQVSKWKNKLATTSSKDIATNSSNNSATLSQDEGENDNFEEKQESAPQLGNLTREDHRRRRKNNSVSRDDAQTVDTHDNATVDTNTSGLPSLMNLTQDDYTVDTQDQTVETQNTSDPSLSSSLQIMADNAHHRMPDASSKEDSVGTGSNTSNELLRSSRKSVSRRSFKDDALRQSEHPKTPSRRRSASVNRLSTRSSATKDSSYSKITSAHSKASGQEGKSRSSRSSSRGVLTRTRSSSLNDLQNATRKEEQNEEPQKRKQLHRRSKGRNSHHANSEGSSIDSTTKPDSEVKIMRGLRRSNTYNERTSAQGGGKLGVIKRRESLRRIHTSDPADPTLHRKKKHDTSHRSSSKSSKPKESSSSGISNSSSTGRKEDNGEARRGRSSKKKTDGSKQKRQSSQPPKDSARVEPKRGVARTRSQSLSDLRSPRRTSREPRKAHHAKPSPRTATTEHTGDQKTASSSKSSLGSDADAAVPPGGRRNRRSHNKVKLRRSTTGEHKGKKDSSSKPQKEDEKSPAAHRRSEIKVEGSDRRPNLVRNRSSSLSDLRPPRRSLEKRADNTAVVAALGIDGEEQDIKKLRAHIQKMESELKDVPDLGNSTVSTADAPSNNTDELQRQLAQPETIISYLNTEQQRETTEQKRLKEGMFDMQHENVKAEEQLEKTRQYHSELEGIHSAEVMKSEALLKNVPVFQKVIEAHELKLARRARYIEFERQTRLFYEGRMRSIVRNFQAKCDDRQLVKTLEQMTGMGLADNHALCKGTISSAELTLQSSELSLSHG